MKWDLRRVRLVLPLAVLALGAIVSFQNCSRSVPKTEVASAQLSSINSATTLPTATISLSPSTWRVGSGETASLTYTTSNATSVSGYHIFQGFCALGQSQGGVQLAWDWVDTVGQKTWSQVMGPLASGQRDDRGCSIQYCVVATNSKGSREACAMVQIVDYTLPSVSLTLTPSVWRMGSGDTLSASYTTTNATSSRGYHVFSGSCSMAQQYSGQQVAWEFGNNVSGNSWTGVAGQLEAGQRDDRGCSIQYCVVASNSTGSTESCQTITVQ